MKTDYTISELIEYRNALVAQNDAEAPAEILEMAQVAEQLVKGKVDQAARFRAGLKAHIEAAQEQLAALERMMDMTEQLMTEAVTKSESSRVEGETYVLRLQNNSRASVVIEDEAQIPNQHRNVSLTISFPYSEEELLFYSGVLLKRVVGYKRDLTSDEMASSFFYRVDVSDKERALLESVFKISVSKSAIESMLKEKPDSVPGAKLERGKHLRVEVLKSKAKLLKEAIHG